MPGLILAPPPGQMEIHLVTGHPAILVAQGLPEGAMLEIRDAWARCGITTDGITRWVLTAEDVASLTGASHAHITDAGRVILAGPIHWSTGWIGYPADGQATVVYLTGPPGPVGPTGPMGPAGPAGSGGGGGSPYLLAGPGRPDQPATTGGIITGAEPIGAIYASTDGGLVGAWTWQRHPLGWVVSHGDTGWRDIRAAWGSPSWMTLARLRRTDQHVTCHLLIPAGAAPESTMMPVPQGMGVSAPEIVGLPLAGSRGAYAGTAYLHAANLLWLTAPAGDGINTTITWTTDQPWPSTLPGLATT